MYEWNYANEHYLAWINETYKVRDKIAKISSYMYVGDDRGKKPYGSERDGRCYVTNPRVYLQIGYFKDR